MTIVIYFFIVCETEDSGYICQINIVLLVISTNYMA